MLRRKNFQESNWLIELSPRKNVEPRILGIIIVNSFILYHFNYCPLIWLFCSNTSQKKLEKVNERALRLALSDYTSSYKDLLINANSTTIHIHSIRLLALEIY